MFTDSDAILSLDQASIKGIDTEKYKNVKLQFRESERRSFDITLFTFDLGIFANDNLRSTQINSIIQKCKKNPKRLVHKFDSIWVACDPITSKGKNCALKRVIMSQADDENHFKVLNFYTDHGDSTTNDPYINYLCDAESRWLSINPTKYLVFLYISES